MAATQAACTGRATAQGCRGQGTRGTHFEHLAHVRDLGRVEVEPLVERRRLLPRRKAGMRCGKRCGPGGVGALGGSGMHWKVPTQGCGARARAQRTRNMPYIFVTLEVFQLEMSALKFFKL